jgi:diphosphomevalonate decarboxylase
MDYSEYYLKESRTLKFVNTEQKGSIAWECPSNIALIKYWGKRDGQLPMNPSLSFALSNSVTKTELKYHYDQTLKGLELDFTFEDKKDVLFKSKIEDYLKSVEKYLPFLNKTRLEIRSENTFPHSAGIASSASSFGALALCLVSIEKELTGIKTSDEHFFMKASFLARMGSGSAARSLFGGYSVWGKYTGIENSSDEISVPLENRINPVFSDYQDVVLIIDEVKKTVSSTEGHKLMHGNPFAVARFQQARTNLGALLPALETGDLETFIQIVENEALSLHAMMMTSSPGYFLIKHGTLHVIEKVRDYRKTTGIPLTFTLDAGPNVHLLFPEIFRKDIMDFIQNELIQYCNHGKFIIDRVGKGPVQLNDK